MDGNVTTGAASAAAAVGRVGDAAGRFSRQIDEGDVVDRFALLQFQTQFDALADFLLFDGDY